MSQTTTIDPGALDRFRDQRLRPALDLLAALPPVLDGPVIDLGCGSGAVGPALRERFSGPLHAVDLSREMLDLARETGAYDTLHPQDIASWTPETPPALIFANAALHWVQDHETLLPRLAAFLPQGGVLAVQVPNQNHAPSHRLWLDLAERIAPEAVRALAMPAALQPMEYHNLLSPSGRVDVWETEYYQVLAAEDDIHPVRRFTSATYGRPVLNALGVRAEEVVAEYDNVMETIYPRRRDDTVIFPFRRLFLTFTKH